MTSLTRYANEGDLNGIRCLLTQGTPVDFIENGRFNETALMVAARAGHLEIVTLLLDSGANINHRDNDDFSPVCAAARAGKWSVLEVLAKRGGDFSHRDGYRKCGIDYLKRCRSKPYREEILNLITQQGAPAE